ncbi:MAG: transposase [Candidatus Competibacteraceae bacterium]|nr:transposase [Candidatus Competibacteraceae bacterium]
MLAVLPDRLQTTVQVFLEGDPTELKATVQRVGMDRWEGYAGAVAAALPQASIVVDRFHVAVQYQPFQGDFMSKMALFFNHRINIFCYEHRI